MTQSTDQSQTAASEQPPNPLRTFFISGFGSAMEYYDFLVYGLAAALVFGPLFFPSDDPLIGTLLALSAFGVGFFARPLGGLVIGHFGDRLGRRRMLILTLLVMGIATVGVGCLPTFDTVGPLAPILLVVLRLVQGFAAGGEWGGAALFGIESAPENRRGLWGSFTSMGVGVGGLLGVVVFTTVSWVWADELLDWAWRVPFLLGGALVIVGLILRLRLQGEDTLFTQDGAEEVAQLPIVAVLRSHRRPLVLGILLAIGYNTIAYLGYTFFLTYAKSIGYESNEALTAQLTYSVAVSAFPLFFGRLSDKIGRRATIATGAVLMAGFMFAFFPLVHQMSMPLTILGFVIAGVLTVVMQGPLPAMMAEQFPAGVRYSGISASYQIGAAIGGGTAPVAATAIYLAAGESGLAVSLYACAAAVVVTIAVLAMREGSKLTLEELNA